MKHSMLSPGLNLPASPGRAIEISKDGSDSRQSSSAEAAQTSAPRSDSEDNKVLENKAKKERQRILRQSSSAESAQTSASQSDLEENDPEKMLSLGLSLPAYPGRAIRMFKDNSDLRQSSSAEPAQTSASQSEPEDNKILGNKTKKEHDRLLRHMSELSPSAKLRTSENQNVCADIEHPQWDAVRPSLRKYVQARMQKALAQEQHFGEEHLKTQQGICFGLGTVWIRLHQAAKVHTTAADRMALLMAESGTTHGTIQQRLYALEYEHALSSENFFKKLFSTPNLTQLDLEIPNMTSLYAIERSSVAGNFSSKKEEYIRLGKLLNESPGYYDMTCNLKDECDDKYSHSFTVFSAGNPHPITFYDSNLGECLVPENEFPRFMQEMSRFYQDTRKMSITGIRSVLKVEFTDHFKKTPLAGLVTKPKQD